MLLNFWPWVYIYLNTRCLTFDHEFIFLNTRCLTFDHEFSSPLSPPASLLMEHFDEMMMMMVKVFGALLCPCVHDAQGVCWGHLFDEKVDENEEDEEKRRETRKRRQSLTSMDYLNKQSVEKEMHNQWSSKSCRGRIGFPQRDCFFTRLLSTPGNGQRVFLHASFIDTW